MKVELAFIYLSQLTLQTTQKLTTTRPFERGLEQIVLFQPEVLENRLSKK